MADKSQELYPIGPEVEAIRKAAAEMPKGEPGECVVCGEYSGRLVKGVCASCRDVRVFL